MVVGPPHKKSRASGPSLFAALLAAGCDNRMITPPFGVRYILSPGLTLKAS